MTFYNKYSLIVLHNDFSYSVVVFVLPTSKIQLIIPEKKYEGESTDWATLSCIGVVCKDWNREMNLVSYDTIIRTSLSNFIHDNDQQQTTFRNQPSTENNNTQPSTINNQQKNNQQQSIRNIFATNNQQPTNNNHQYYVYVYK